MPGWYDGPRSGIADYLGKPHVFESLWATGGGGCWAGLFLLMPIDEETFALAMEDWTIWLRWISAFRAGEVTQDTSPTLPQDRQRHEAVVRLLGQRLEVVTERSITVRGDFRDGDHQVLWTPVEESIDGMITFSALTSPGE